MHFVTHTIINRIRYEQKCSFNIFMTDELFVSPLPDEFLKWNNTPSSFGTIHFHFSDIQMRTKLVSQQYTCIAWADWADVQAGLALYWWQ